MQAIPRSIPFGRLDELRSHPDAALIAYTLGRGMFDDLKIKVYSTRGQLEAFCKDGSSHHALVKTPTHPNMLTNRNTQRPT